MSDTMLNSDTGKRIQFLREKSQISQAELAIAIGVSKQTIHRYETDPSVIIPFDIIEKLAIALNSTIDYLLCQPNASGFNEDINDDPLSPESFAADPFFKMMKLSKEERDTYINTGAFNAYIEGYLILTMKEAGFTKKEIEKTADLLQNKIFEDYTAKMARNASENMYDIILDDGIQIPPQDNLYHIRPRGTKSLK